MGKIKLMFWSLVLSGIVMSYNAFNSPSKMLNFNEIKKGDFSSIQEMVNAVKEGEKNQEAYAPRNNQPGLKIDNRQPSNLSATNSKVFDIDGADYVYIRGKYLPYNPENIYYIDGEKIYYSVGEQRREVEKQVVTRQRIKLTEDEKIDLNPVKAYSPKNIKNMMKTLKSAQQNINNRNNILSDLDKQSDFKNGNDNVLLQKKRNY